MTTAIRFAEPADAAALHRVIYAAFSARPPVQPPAEALADTVETVREALEHGYGVLVERDDEPIAGLLIDVDGEVATLRRVSVVPTVAGTGVGVEMVAATITALADLGCRSVEVVARNEFPKNIAWWSRAGFMKLRDVPHGQVMGRGLPTAVQVPDAEAMRSLGRKLATLLHPGDVLIAAGELGAGKTTLAQGIGEGLDVEGPIISPTFVLSRIHPSRNSGPNFVHVDAYRLASADELADIDLQETQASSVTLIEWGRGVAEWLTNEPLMIEIQRSDDPASNQRTVYLMGIGRRWDGVVDQLRECA